MTPASSTAIPLKPRQDELPEDEQYRKLSAWPIVALLLGLATPLSLVSPVLWLVPCLAILVGGFALWRIRAEPRRASGSLAATIGLVAGLFFLSYSVTRAWGHQSMLVGYARQHAETWLNLLRDSKTNPTALFQAHELYLVHESRQPAGADLHAYYHQKQPPKSQRMQLDPRVEDMEPIRGLEQAFSQEPLQGLLEGLQNGGSYRFVKALAGRRLDFRTEQQALLYSFTSPMQPKEWRLVIVLKRAVNLDSGFGHWDIDGVSLPGEPLPSPR